MKTSNFKKVLALVLALAMVLSVCTMSFSVSAETADLSYYVFNDGTVDGAWTNGSSQKAVSLGGDVALRIAPQRTGKSQVNVTLEKGDLTADDFATVNTLSYYVKNETGAPLSLRYQYYLSNGSSGYFNGYVYLVATDEAEILPYKADKQGNITLPAKFEGYIVYDLSASANYGNVSLNLGDGVWDTTNPVVDYIKAQSFSNMTLFYDATEDMLTKAFYLDDVAVSTKTVEELAKFLTNDEIVSYNFNMASSKSLDADESAVFWGARYANLFEGDNGARPDVVDYDDGLDGKGLKFTVANRAGESVGGIVIRKSFVATRGTNLPFAIDKAVGIKYDVTTEGYHTMQMNVGGQGNTISGTQYFVYEDGTVMYEPGGIPANFKGTVYHIFDEKAIKGETTWADFINARTSDTLSLTPYTSVNGVSEGATITFGGFEFIYDAEPIVAAFAKEEAKNPVVLDGNEFPHQWSNAAYSSYDQNWTVYGGKEITAVYKGTATRSWLVFNSSAKNIELDAANVKGFSFKLKTPAEGTTTLDIDMAGSNEQPFYGIMYAIDKYGNVVASVDAVKTGTSNNSKLTLPAGFDGIIVMDAAGAGAFCAGWNGATKYASYAEFYAAKKFRGVRLGIANSAGLVVGETTYVYDDLTVIYDTVEDYIAAYQASCPEISNPVFRDGTENPLRWGSGSYGSYGGDWTVKSDGSKVTAVFTNDSYTDPLPNNLYFNKSGTSYAIDSVDVANIKGLSFEFKVPDDSYNHTLKIHLDSQNQNYYHGGIVAINGDGTTAFERTYGYNNAITLPAGFDGIIVLTGTSSSGNPWSSGYLEEASYVSYATFAEYYAAKSNKFRGLSFFVGTTGEYTVNVSTYEYDNLKLITQDTSEYIKEIQTKLQAEFIAEAEAGANTEGGFVVNTFTGIGNDKIGVSGNANTVLQNNVMGFLSDDLAVAELKWNPDTPTGSERRVTMNVNDAGFDASKMAGFTYKIEVINPGKATFSNSFQINAQQNGLQNADIYLINDATGEITKSSKVTIKDNFVGRVVVLFNEDTRVTATWSNSDSDAWTKGSRTWAEFIANNAANSADPLYNIGMWVGDAPTTNKLDADGNPVLDAEGKNVKVLTEAGEQFVMYYDDLGLLYDESPIISHIDKAYTNSNNFNAANNLSSIGVPYSTYGIYETSIVALDEAPNGYATYFDRVKDTYTVETTDEVTGETTTEEKKPGSTTHSIKLANSNLTQEKLAAMEAVSFWVKIPEGTSKTFQPEFNTDGNYYKGVYIVIDQNTGEVTYHDYKVNGASIELEGGFTGYVILPLKYAAFSTGWSHDPAKFTAYTDLMKTNKLNNFTFYWSNAHQDWYMGEVKMIENLADYLVEFGVEQVSGDINNDTVADVRDLVRLKKFNADSLATTVAYQNLDIDKNGLVETASELIASRKQMLDIEYEATEIDASLVDYPETMVGIYHSYYGAWDSLYSDHIAENEIVNMYSTTDIYELAQMKEKGSYAWFYLHESYGNERVFGDNTAYDREATEINPAYKTALDAKIQQLKDLGLWNTVVGFTTEEILMGDQTSGMTQAQFAIWTEYLAETYGKRFNACLSTYEVKGGTHTNKEGKQFVSSAANAETYAYVTDIGYDWYTGDLAGHEAMLATLMDNIGTKNDDETITRRTDIKYWFYPTAYSGDGTDDDVLSGTPTRSDATCAEQIRMFDTLLQSVPEAQRGGLYFYTWSDWSDSYGLESLIGEYGYTETLAAIIEVASKYVK